MRQYLRAMASTSDGETDPDRRERQEGTRRPGKKDSDEEIMWRAIQSGVLAGSTGEGLQ